MNDMSRQLVAIGASLAIFYVWYTWIAPMPVQEAPAAEVVATAPADPEVSSIVPAAAPAQASVQSNIPEKSVSISTALVDVELSNTGAVPTQWQLRDYVKDVDGETVPIDLAESSPLGLTVEGFAVLPKDARYRVERVGGHGVDFVWSAPNLDIRKQYRFHDDSYVADLSVVVTNHGAAAVQGSIGVGWQAENMNESAGGFLSMFNPPADVWIPLYAQDGSIERLDDEDDLLASVQRKGNIAWAGAENRYFLGAILPREASSHQFRAELVGEAMHTGLVNTEIRTGAVVVPAGSSVQKDFTVYVGPKDIGQLSAASPLLEGAIDYGFVSIVAMPILHLLKFFYGVIQNYGVAIVLLTLVIKGLLHPITKKSMESMKKMQQVQPLIKELKEKYGDDKEKLNAEMMQMFKARKINPAGGCLPMLLQLPVYFALYRVLWNSIELYRAPFFGYLQDLSAPDPYYITPVLLGVAFFLQQKLTPSPSADPAQKNMMMMMSLMFPLFMAFLPSGLVIYILINTLFTVLQQWLMNRGLGFRDLLKGDLAVRT